MPANWRPNANGLSPGIPAEPLNVGHTSQQSAIFLQGIWQILRACERAKATPRMPGAVLAGPPSDALASYEPLRAKVERIVPPGHE
jgi:hypothetical protein